jgi:hypothetical protein
MSAVKMPLTIFLSRGLQGVVTWFDNCVPRPHYSQPVYKALSPRSSESSCPAIEKGENVPAVMV